MRQTITDGHLEAYEMRLKVQKSTILGKAIKDEASSGPLGPVAPISVNCTVS